MIANMIERVLVWTVCPVQHPCIIIPWSSNQIVCRTEGSIACIGILNTNHSIDVFLNILNKSLDDVQLAWTIHNKFFDGVVDLFFVLTNATHL